MATSHCSDDDRTLWVGNIDSSVNEEILWELFLQAAPLESVTIPKDPKTGRQRNYGFIMFRHEDSVQYVIDLMDGIKLYGTPLALNRKSKTGKGSEENLGRLTPKSNRMNPDHGPDYQRTQRDWGFPCRPPLNFMNSYANPFFITQYPFQNMQSYEARALPPHRHTEEPHFRHGPWSGNAANTSRNRLRTGEMNRGNRYPSPNRTREDGY